MCTLGLTFHLQATKEILVCLEDLGSLGLTGFFHISPLGYLGIIWPLDLTTFVLS